MTILYNTEQQTIDSVTELLTAHGYDPTQYDLPGIADGYYQQHDNYDVLEHPGTIWAAIFDNDEHKTNRPPSNFVLRDWDAPEYDDTAPRDRYVLAEGPESGGVESNWQPGWGVLIDLPAVGHTGDGLGVSIEDARRLRDDLTAVLDQLNQ